MCCAVVKAYQYTSITSVMLLDCWAIPMVMLFTWLFLKTKYRFKKISDMMACVGGLVMVIFSDVHASDRGGRKLCQLFFFYIVNVRLLGKYRKQCRKKTIDTVFYLLGRLHEHLRK